MGYLVATTLDWHLGAEVVVVVVIVILSGPSFVVSVVSRTYCYWQSILLVIIAVAIRKCMSCGVSYPAYPSLRSFHVALVIMAVHGLLYAIPGGIVDQFLSFFSVQVICGWLSCLYYHNSYNKCYIVLVIASMTILHYLVSESE